VSLDNANRGLAESEKNSKRFQQQLREIQQSADEDQRTSTELKEQLTASERRANTIAHELEELCALMEAAERARKASESDMNEAVDRVNDLQLSNNGLMSAKKKLEADVKAMRVCKRMLRYCFLREI